MIGIFSSIDLALFHFFNQTIANPFFDLAMPILTDLNKHWYGLAIFIGAWLFLVLRGGKKGKYLGIAVLIVLTLSDQLSSHVLKTIFLRPRPCWNEPGVLVIPNLRLLVSCGGGYSFPSSHAANSFAVATFLSYYYRKATPYLFTFAVLMSVSRTYVGVHYPTDVIGGALVGVIIAIAMILAVRWIGEREPRLALPASGGRGI